MLKAKIASGKKKTVAKKVPAAPKAVKSSSVKPKEAKETIFQIVAIGASSGGLEAITELLKNLPADTGMAFIFIQHLSPDYKSLLVSLLAKSTKMLVQEIEDMARLKPNNVYVIPYNKGIEVTDGHVVLTPRSKKGVAMSIDILFTSLAETHKENAIGVILSGNASDGTKGLKAIKQEGGITFVQDKSAKYGGMPESAIHEGVADFILSPKQIALELGRISKHVFSRKKNAKAESEHVIEDGNPDLKSVIGQLYDGIGVDFSHYKMNTIKRRILRRMFFYKLNTIKEYAKLLKTNSDEIGLLYNDLLINFTDFFRDPESFQYFKTVLFPKLLKSKTQSETLRIWVVACSTGQEAYSMAMLLIEILGNKFPGKKVQIFASDLSEPSIKKARGGEFSAQDVKGISPKRMERFFTKVGDSYRIDKSVRDMCTFAPHNILSNPPFSRMDFISCCNLLIYLDAAMHKKVLKTFHYALNDGGSLMLGKSETIGSSLLFSQTNRKYKVYTRKTGKRSLPDLASFAPLATITKTEPLSYKRIIELTPAATDAAISAIIFSRYMPAYVVINHAMTILQFKGETSKYLEHTTGKASLNILNMARPEIAFDLLEGINKAIETKQEVTKTGIEIKDSTIIHTVTLDVIPLEKEGEEPALLIIFTEQEHKERFEGNFKLKNNGLVQNGNVAKKLREDIAVIKAELISVTEEKDKENKILQAAKEEILSSNEEFQCMNEELETSKEEIESANEELITTNQELQTRNEQLTEAYDFSEAIITTLHEPMLILDIDLRVKSANKAYFKEFRVTQADTEGKLIYELGNGQWNIAPLRELLGTIIQKETFFYDYEITHVFPHIGRRTMLLNASRIMQKVQNEQLILLAIADTTEVSLKRRADTKGLEDIISERTAELAQSNKSLKERNYSLERSNKDLETFTFISSHDLQEPLRKIKNFATCLLEDEHKKLSVTGKDYLGRMQETVKRMQMLIDDLLTYSRAKSSKHVFEKTDLNVIVKEVMVDFKESLKEKKGILKSSGLSTVNIIPFQFRQVFSNLISNSIKFADPKRLSRIFIKSETIPGSKLDNNSLLPETQYCHITYTDNGIGFDPQYKDRIFEVFQRLHEYDEYNGTGIGLAICKRIIENHNGIITATGELGKGVKFDIYIPVGL